MAGNQLGADHGGDAVSPFRNRISAIHNTRRQPMPGYDLLLTYPDEEKVDSKASAQHFSAICKAELPADAPYRRAFVRWKELWEEQASGKRASVRALKFAHRVLIDSSQASLWENHIALMKPYGIPFLPGSSLKGLAKDFAAQLNQPEPLIQSVFGNGGAHKKVDIKNAWWVPDSAPVATGGSNRQPLVREGVTPHHPRFYSSKGKVPPTPLDDPEPSPQLATHGCYLFVVTGPNPWADYALDLLQVGLECEGIGARSPEYGRITGNP